MRTKYVRSDVVDKKCAELEQRVTHAKMWENVAHKGAAPAYEKAKAAEALADQLRDRLSSEAGKAIVFERERNEWRARAEKAEAAQNELEDQLEAVQKQLAKESQVEKLKHRIAELEKFNAEAHNWNSKLQSKIAQLQRELDGCVIGELRIRLIIGE